MEKTRKQNPEAAKLEVVAGDFITYRTEYMDAEHELDRHGLVLEVNDKSVSISYGDSLDCCGLDEVKSVIPGSDVSRELVAGYNENLNRRHEL